MPKTLSSLPEKLRPYVALGVDFLVESPEAKADCLLCGGEGSLYINPGTGQGDCKKAGCALSQGFNSTKFAQIYHAECFSATSDYSELEKSRGIKETTFIRWQVARSIATGEWLIPGYTINGKLINLYRYRLGGKLYGLPGVSGSLHFPDSYNNGAGVLWICEGPWDAMALWELVDNDTIVIAVPGANVFSESWAKSDLFSGREIVFAYDSDHPRKDRGTGKVFPPAGYSGLKRAARILSSEVEAEDLYYIEWGENGYDPELPDGYDLRDALKTPLNTRESRLEALELLKGRITRLPPEGLLTAKDSNGKPSGSSELAPLECEKYSELVEAWEKAMRWTGGLDCALSVMLASSLTTKLVGEQLWVKIISPPGSGKTTLVEGLSVARKYTFSKDTIRGFYSGWTTGNEDLSIAALAKDRTLIIKDGDTLLKSPNLSQILSEGRGLYDGAGRTHYRNAVSRDYEGHRMTWILCGTSALREIDDSELGSRFLDCVIMEGIDEDFEREVGLRAGEQELRNLLMQSNGVAEERYNPDLTKAMRMTGGYVNYLRENDVDLVSSVVPDSSLVSYCGELANFVSRMRARPSRTQEEEATREFSARLVKQLIRLSISLATVMNKRTVDKEVRERVTKVARDTARGITYEIASLLYEAGKEGSNKNSLAVRTDITEGKMDLLLRFLKRIGVVTNFKKVDLNGATKGGVRWRLTPRMRELYESVMEIKPKEDDNG